MKRAPGVCRETAGGAEPDLRDVTRIWSNLEQANGASSPTRTDWRRQVTLPRLAGTKRPRRGGAAPPARSH